MASRGILFLIAIFSLLIMQTGNALVLAEQAGLVGHVESVGCGSHEDSTPGGRADHHDSGCCCAPVVLLMCDAVPLTISPAGVFEFLSVTDDISRDALAREIDYPPQLG